MLLQYWCRHAWNWNRGTIECNLLRSSRPLLVAVSFFDSKILFIVQRTSVACDNLMQNIHDYTLLFV